MSLCSRLQQVYCARDRAFPNQRRKIWESDRYCCCPSPSCDHCYPHCLNELGGVCTECMLHDDHFGRLAHDASLGGLAKEHGQPGAGGGGANGADSDDDDAGEVELTAAALEADGDAEEEGRLFDPPYPHQTDFEFSLRISPTAPENVNVSGGLVRPGRYWVTVAAAPERVRRALRKQRIREGEDPYHATLYSIWLEECVPRGDPRLGNTERVAQAEERARARAANAALKRAFGRKLDQRAEEQTNKEAEEKLLREYGMHGEIDGRSKKQKPVESVADAVATPEQSKTKTDS